MTDQNKPGLPNNKPLNQSPNLQHQKDHQGSNQNSKDKHSNNQNPNADRTKK